MKKVFLALAVMASVVCFNSCRKGSELQDDATPKEASCTLPTNLSNTTHYIGYISLGNDSVRVDTYVDPNDNIALVLFDGRQLEKEPQKDKVYYDEDMAFARFDELIERYPCVEIIRQEYSAQGSLFNKATTAWIIFYDDTDEDGDCWFNKLNK